MCPERRRAARLVDAGLRCLAVHARRLTDRGDGQRSLVSRLLGVLLVTALFVYLTVNVGLWWTSTRLIEEHLLQQAGGWITELDELGTPLYVSRGAQRLVKIDERIKNFPEIAFVRYYDASGRRVLGEYGRAAEARVPLPSTVQLAALNAPAEPGRHYAIDRSLSRGEILRLLAPVRVRAIRADGLFGFSLNRAPAEDVKTVGYIDLGLDLGYYREELLRSIAYGSVVIAFVFALALLVGHRLIRRALAPLTALQAPLLRLAHGDTEVRVAAAGDREIRAIGEALNTTITAIRQRDDALRRLAEQDPLTGLSNRASFMRELENERRRLAESDGGSAVFFVDLDQFKYVNDTLGHATGDRLLVQVAGLLRARLREQDVVSRFGGDEFLVLARNATRAEAAEIARSLNEMMRETTLVEGGQVVMVNCSIGIALLNGGRESVEDILSHADMACYAAKTRGRNRYHVYEPGEEERLRMTSDIGWSQRVKRAIKEDRFRLVYQPIQGVRADGTEHYEVLLRLPCDNGEIVMPGVFLPVAQRFGLLAEIDRWVIAHALRALAAFRAGGRDLVFSINLSGESFEDAALLDLIRGQLEANRLPGRAVVFEITEQTAVRYFERAQDTIRGLIALGCRFALDDFGQGFSSFSTLKHLPVDFIKIDGSFVRNLGEDTVDQAMVRSIVQIARALDKRTVAEFVQDEASVNLLRESGVDYLQGYYIGKPAEQLPALRRAASWG